MLKRNKVHDAVFFALSAGALSTSVNAQQIEEITVTATKRSESMQDIPLAVQAMGAEALEEQNIQSFSDYVQYLPSVNAGGRGPGQNEIYIRGAAVDAINITVAESQGSAPNVALYLDEQPITSGGRNLDVYVTDMERIEVLPGPQGTLYGASSMAGTVRLITNKPNLNEFQASFNGSWSKTAHGEDSNSLEAMINLPIIEDKFAIRAALYNDQQGGYIDNVAGTFVADPALNPTFPGDTVTYGAGTILANGTVVGPGGLTVPVIKEVADNSGLVENDFNDASYAGIRLGGKYIFNDEWDLLVQHTRQTLKTEGVFDYDPAKGDLNVSRFTKDSLQDEFAQTAWTVNGRLGDLDVVYTGAFLDREVDANLDYTGYTNIGGYIRAYQCEYLTPGYSDVAAVTGTTNGYNFDPTIGGDPGVVECGNPANAVRLKNEMTRSTHEFRVSSDFESAFNFTAGVFYENFEIEHIGDFNYLGPFEAGFAPLDITTNSSFDNAATNAFRGPAPETQFRNDNLRTEEQIAIFGEVTFDISDQFSVAAGARYYDLEYDFQGYGAFRYGTRPLFVDDADPTNDIRPNYTGGRDYAANLGDIAPIKTDDTIFKFTASWTPNGDSLFYASWSEGFRPPGINRGAARFPFDPAANNTNNVGTNCGTDVAIDADAGNGFPGYCLPYVFESDTLENIEFGWKTSLFDGTVQFNGAIYRIDWENIQVSQFDSQNISIFTLVDNGGDAEITGIEMDVIWGVSDALTIYGAASVNNTELVFVDPAFAFVVADEGSPLPLTPDIQFSVRGRYEWVLENGYDAFWQLGMKYADEALNSLVDTVTEPNKFQDSYALVDGAVGFSSTEDGWGVELFVKNLTDERAQLHINRQDFMERTTTNRPRTIGLRFSYDF
ncbi:MAG: TonB-dependent receptor [Woeseia sp.]|jgi:iron complex outermembrane recepter protein|nr:TonB-dependent receptor [Woeseia sp.]MBT6209682.1 TonB-dependent receptor [Woeseia sp.]